MPHCWIWLGIAVLGIIGWSICSGNWREMGFFVCFVLTMLPALGIEIFYVGKFWTWVWHPDLGPSN